MVSRNQLQFVYNIVAYKKIWLLKYTWFKKKNGKPFFKKIWHKYIEFLFNKNWYINKMNMEELIYQLVVK